MSVGIRTLGNPTQETAEGNVALSQTVGPKILTSQLQAKKSDLQDIACIFVKLYTKTNCNDWPRKTQLRNSTMQSIAFNNAMPKIVDHPWTLIFRTCQRAFHFPFSLKRLPTFSLWKYVTSSPLIADGVRLKIVDTQLTLTSITSKQRFYTQWMYATNHIHSIGIQYSICMYYHLHPGVLLPLNFKSTAIHAIWVRDEVALLHSHTFSREFMACWSFH